MLPNERVMFSEASVSFSEYTAIALFISQIQKL